MKILSTFTTEGEIPYLQMQHSSGVFLAPVKIAFKPGQTWDSGKQYVLQEPVRRGGKLVFALPGGGEYVS